ncbi:IS3 family transposase [Streptomyces avermitilis]|uniref:IS3 family transposase n=1 Tax=Streptomyces avermitilis TaxID=33903 RepID=UPI0033D9E699
MSPAPDERDRIRAAMDRILQGTAQHSNGALTIVALAQEAGVPSSTYYRWRHAQKEPCERHRRDAELTGIRQVHEDSDGIYGSLRVHAVLKREGVHVGRKRVERLMREAGLAGISPRRAGKGFTRRDPDADLAPDLVQRDFTAKAPNRLWVTDLRAMPRRRPTAVRAQR